MSDPSFGGIWTYPSTGFPGHDEFMCIDESRGRIITFLVMTVEPVRYGPMRSWYRPESATAIVAKLRPADPWRRHEVQLDGDRLVWTYGNAAHPWRRALPHEYPDWLAARLAAENSRMDAAEEAA